MSGSYAMWAPLRCRDARVTRASCGEVLAYAAVRHEDVSGEPANPPDRRRRTNVLS